MGEQRWWSARPGKSLVVFGPSQVGTSCCCCRSCKEGIPDWQLAWPEQSWVAFEGLQERNCWRRCSWNNSLVTIFNKITIKWTLSTPLVLPVQIPARSSQSHHSQWLKASELDTSQVASFLARYSESVKEIIQERCKSVRTLFRLARIWSSTMPPSYLDVINNSDLSNPLSRMAIATACSFLYAIQPEI